MEANICPRCGENLRLEGNTLICSYCGATYEKESGEKASYLLRSILDEVKMERLANCRRLMWDAAHEKYPSKERVCDAAKAVLSLHADDFLGRIYLHSHDRDPLKMNLILADSEVSSPEAEETFRWLLPSLSPRMVGPLHDFVDRHFSNDDRIDKVNKIEEEADKIYQGIYEPGLPRDVFLCYSSADMAKVVEVMDILEQNGFTCFAAFRNLRHGKGAQENYLSAIKEAMRSCEVLLFLSSESSRSMECDALKVELPYLIQEMPNKSRIEYLFEDYSETPYMVKKTLKKAFPEQERCVDIEDLMDRISAALAKEFSDKPETKTEYEELLKKKEAEFQQELDKAKKEAEDKIREQILTERLAKELPLVDHQAESKEKEKNDAPRFEGDYVYYGRYPQSKVTDPKTIKALRRQSVVNGDRIVYEGSEYVKSGKKEYYHVEPIKWRLLEKENGEAYLLSDVLLDVHRFDASSNKFDTSQICGWLNVDFKEAAFPDGGSYILAQGSEAVSLPTKVDIENGSYVFKRLCKLTPYANRYRSGNHYYYWTKTPGSAPWEAYSVDGDGRLRCGHVGNSLSVRPTIHIKIPD